MTDEKRLGEAGDDGVMRPLPPEERESDAEDQSRAAGRDESTGSELAAPKQSSDAEQ